MHLETNETVNVMLINNVNDSSVFFKSHNHSTLTLNANAACQEDVSEFNADVLLIFV